MLVQGDAPYGVHGVYGPYMDYLSSPGKNGQILPATHFAQIFLNQFARAPKTNMSGKNV